MRIRICRKDIVRAGYPPNHKVWAVLGDKDDVIVEATAREVPTTPGGETHVFTLSGGGSILATQATIIIESDTQ